MQAFQSLIPSLQKFDTQEPDFKGIYLKRGGDTL